MAKIIPFPKQAIIPITKQDANERIKRVRTEFCDEVMEECLRNLLLNVGAYGINFTNDGPHQKDLIMLSEVLQATIYRYSGLDHAMHGVISELISIEGEEPDEPIRRRRKKKPAKKQIEVDKID